MSNSLKEADLPDPRHRHERKICLRNDSHDTSPICDLGIPLLRHIIFPFIIYDEREGVDECQDENSPGYPNMEDNQALMGDTRQSSDQICFRGK